MIASNERDSCSQLVAGNCDVIIGGSSSTYNESIVDDDAKSPSASQSLKAIMTNFLDRFEHHESELVNPRDCSYATEFKLLKEFSNALKEDKANLQDGELELNSRKNRYKDIIPFSHTRVILKSNPDEPGSCYINANYIKGPSGSPRTYIACQGPLACTLDDFWRMIWECGVSVIVMACNENESGKPKCELYWPDELDTSARYGNIEVTLSRVRQINSDFLIRKFLIKYFIPKEAQRIHDDSGERVLNMNQNNNNYNSNHGGKEMLKLPASDANVTNNDNNHNIDQTADHSTNDKLIEKNLCDDGLDMRQSRDSQENYQDEQNTFIERTVCQFHYTTWPDHGVPDSVAAILELVRLMREVQPAEDRPILIHCSAGCGRTGTICCIDYVWGLLRRGKLGSKFDLCNIISEMRQQRMAMVQTLEQYILCHRAVAALFIQQMKLIDNHVYYNVESIDEDDVFEEPEELGPVFI